MDKATRGGNPKLTNWTEKETWETLAVKSPRTLQELTSLVKECRKAKLPVKAMGSLHSFSRTPATPTAYKSIYPD